MNTITPKERLQMAAMIMAGLRSNHQHFLAASPSENLATAALKDADTLISTSGFKVSDTTPSESPNDSNGH